MMNKVIMLNAIELIRGEAMSDARLLGHISMEDGKLVTHPGELGDDKELRIYIKLLKKDNLSLFLAKTISKRTAGDHLLEFVRKARVVIEAEVINSGAMEMLIQRSQIIKSDQGLEFHFGLEEYAEENPIPEIMPCPFCGHAAHWDKSESLRDTQDKISYSRIFVCDSEDRGSCCQSFIWEKST